MTESQKLHEHIEPKATRPYMPDYGLLDARSARELLPWSWVTERIGQTRNCYYLCCSCVRALDPILDVGHNSSDPVIPRTSHQRLSEREHLEKAETIFAEIGAELNLEKVRELLQPEPRQHPSSQLTKVQCA